MIRILLVDDHPVIRTGLHAMLAAYSDLEIVGEARTGEESVARSLVLLPDLVLMDLNLGSGIGGIDATTRIRAQPPPTPQVLVLTNTEREADILAAIEAGAAGYLLKDAQPDELVAGIRKAVAGEAALAPLVAKTLMTRSSGSRIRLTERELQIIRLVAAGRSNRAVASKLVLQEATVKAHLTRIFNKLDVRSRTEAVATARDHGLIDP